MKAEKFLNVCAYNVLLDKGISEENAADIINKRYYKLTYSTGSMSMSQIIMVDENNNFYGIDTINRLVTGSFIDDRYIVFYILNKDESITKFIGYNNLDQIIIQFADVKIYTNLKIEEIPTVDENMDMVKTYYQIMKTIESKNPSILLQITKEISEYQEYINQLPVVAYKLGINKEVPIIKELKK